MKITVIRQRYEQEQTLGTLLVFDDARRLAFKCQTLELPYRDNARNISSVPPGTYTIVREWSPRFKMNLWELKDVPYRSEVKIHVANYVRQLNGCIAVGDMHLDIDNDGLRDVRNSRRTLLRLHEVLEDIENTTITIVEI